MKSVLTTLGAFAALAVAQDLSGLPQCGHICATSMWGSAKAQELGCSANDLACLCKNQNFIFGLRDCSTATCGGDDARKIVEFGLKVCSDAGVQITDGSSGNPTATVSATTSATSQGDDKSGSGGSVSTIFSTSTNDSETIVTAISTTTLGDSASNTGASSGTDGGLVSTVTTDGSTFVTTLATVTSTGDASASATGSGSGASGSATSGGGGSTSTVTSQGAASTTKSDGAAMPQRTLAPAAVLGAGLAALLL